MIRINPAPNRFGSPQTILAYRRGSPLYHQGDTASHWYEVVSGIVRTCRYDSDGHRQLTGFYYAGDVFGLDEGAYKETAESVTDVAVRTHRREPPAATAGGRDTGGEQTPMRRALDTAQRCIFLLGRKTAQARVAAFLLAVQQRLENDGEVDLPMSRSDIGDHLGLTLHTVSRTISELSRRGLIALEGPQSVRILDADGLRALAGESEDEEMAPVERSPAHGAGWCETA